MIQLTPDEIAQVVLARQRRGPWLGLLTASTWLLWLTTAGLTLRAGAEYNALHRLTFRSVVPVLKVPGKAEGKPPDKDAPPVAGGEVTLIYTSRPDLVQPVRPLTARETVWEANHRQTSFNGNLLMAFEAQVHALVAMVLALLATVSLLTASRRATLRQIQASLAAIAGQLAEVQRGRDTMPPTAGG